MSALATDLIAKAAEVEAVTGTPFAEALAEVITHNARKIERRFTADEITEAADEVNDEQREVLQAVAKAMTERVRISKEETDMATLSTMVELAKSGGTDRYEKFEWYSAIAARAQEIRKVSETNAQARVRTMTKDPDGMALYAAYREASGPSARAEERTRPNPRSTLTLMKVEALAEELLAKGIKPTIEQARAQVWEQRPELKKAYDAEYSAAIKKSRR